ncbi:MAG: MBL fold metallo-hydrolase [Candidatus Thermoplasmatota archaeon]
MRDMRLTILYDNEAKEGFRSGWGFSCLVEYNDKKILFDTGWDGDVLLHNMEKSGIAKEEIEAIVLSHHHWDHIGGLPLVLHSNVDVYLPKSFSKRLKHEISHRARLHEVEQADEIIRGVYTTGELGDSIREQALVLEGEEGLIVITGCAHPGLDIVLEAVRKFGEVSGAIGGFHSFDRLAQLDSLSLIAPCHCTAQKEAIRKRFPEKVMPCEAGHTIHVEVRRA